MTALTPNDRLTLLAPAAGTPVLSWDFHLTRSDALRVVRRRSGAKTTLTLGVDYSLPDGLGTPSGGTLTLAVATLAGDVYQLIGLEPIIRLSDFVPSQAFDTAKFNADLDYLTHGAQEARRDIDLAWKTEFGGAGRLIAVGAAGTVPKFDADGNLVEGPDASDIEGAQGYAERAEDAADRAEVAATNAGAGFVLAEHFDAAFDGSDDKTAIEAACAAAIASGGTVHLVGGRTYTVSQLSIPAGTRIRAGGAVIRCLGNLSGSSTRDITIGANCVIDELVMTRPGGLFNGTNTYWCEIGVGTQIGFLKQAADAPWEYNGVLTNGSGVHIDYYEAENVERVFDAHNTSTSVMAEDFYLGFIKVTAYRRGLFMRGQKNFTVGGYLMGTRSSFDGGVAQGQNGILIGGCNLGTIGSGYIGNAGEHAIRIGGDANFLSHDIQFGDAYVYRARGCAIKVNPSGAPTGQRVRRLQFGTVKGVNIGEGPSGVNQEIIRLSHCYGIDIVGIDSNVDGLPSSGHSAVLLNNVNFVHIGSVRGSFNAGIRIDEESDADGVDTFAGNVLNVVVDSFTGTIGGFGNLLNVNAPSISIGPITIRGIDISGFVTGLASFNVGTYAATVALEGRISGAVAPVVAFAGATPGDKVQLDLKWEHSRSSGRASGLSAPTQAALQLATPAFNPANTLAAGVFLNATQAPGGTDAFLGDVSGSRAGSGRRAWAVAGKQTGANSYNTGVSVFIGATSSGTDALIEAATFDHFGNLLMLGAGNGVVLKSPNGTRVLLTVDNSSNPVWTTL